MAHPPANSSEIGKREEIIPEHNPIIQAADTLADCERVAIAWAATLKRHSKPQDGRQAEIDGLIDLAARARVSRQRLSRLADKPDTVRQAAKMAGELL